MPFTTLVPSSRHIRRNNPLGAAKGKLFVREHPGAARRVRASALNTDDGTRCSFPARFDKLFRVAYPNTLAAYLGDLDSRITKFDLPLGASVDARPCGEIVLQVPKVTFMDLYIYPTSTLEVSRHGKKDVEINALNTEIHGSHHVESLDCNNRFQLHLQVVLSAEADTMHANATFQLDVDVPFPLNMTPRPVIEATGTAAVQRTLFSLMDTLCSSIVRDHVAWVKEKRGASRQATASGVATSAAQEQAPLPVA